MASLAGLVSKRNFATLKHTPERAAADELAAAAPSDFARRQLEKFGWKEGGGLGKNQDGNATFITVQRKDGNLGVGAKTAADVLRDTVERGKLVSGSDSDSDSASEDMDTKMFRATGGVRLGMRAQAPQSGKLARLAAADAAFAAEMLLKAAASAAPPAARAASAAAAAPKAAAAVAPPADAAPEAAKAAQKAEKADKKARKADKAEQKAAEKAAAEKAVRKADKKALKADK
ncbi:hypothetical protein T492DRAFT_1063570 [Pavlovales sp. CCMP2436]|nr:hypothetical protein T492DRAFT_1063570 [Pavlovales sp. CCMP2436]